MTDAALIHQGPAAPRQTHVMLIGVGTYEHLNGGGGALSPDNFGLGQLTSPPASARALADWFVSAFDCPDRPLGSVRLLLSEPAPADYTNPRTGVTCAVPKADFINTRAAILKWSEGEVSPDDQLIFYFCGHGLSGGVDELYPLSDFGRNDAADDGPLARAINLNRFATALATVRASNQLLIIDTCRELDDLIAANNNDGSALIVTRQVRRLGIAEKMAQCVIHSTEPDSLARGLPGQPSLCARALMHVLDGAGASRTGGVWRVKSTLISNAITDLQERQFPPGYATQRSDMTRAANIAVRRFPGPPMVPVYIRRQDGGSLVGATVDHWPVGSLHKVSDVATTPEWEGAVPIGSHRFVVAQPGAAAAFDVEETAAPTYLGLEVP